MVSNRKAGNGITLIDTLTSSRYYQSKDDHSRFTQKSHKGFIVILVYVDDLVLGGTDLNEITHIKTLLNNKLNIKNIGLLK